MSILYIHSKNQILYLGHCSVWMLQIFLINKTICQMNMCVNFISARSVFRFPNKSHTVKPIHDKNGFVELLFNIFSRIKPQF